METHLNQNILDAEISVEGYKIFRSDREEGTRKGGVATYIRNDIATSATVLSYGSRDLVEYLLVWLKPMNMIVVTVYRPPTCQAQSFNAVLRLIRDKIDEVTTTLPTVIAMGDYNFPNAE